MRASGRRGSTRPLRPEEDVIPITRSPAPTVPTMIHVSVERDDCCALLEELDTSSSAHMTIEAVPRAARDARAFTRETLEPWCCEATVDDACAVVSEFVSNVSVHTGGTGDLEILRNDATVRIVCTDDGGGWEPPAIEQDGEPPVRGLDIVAEISDRWGATDRDDCDGHVMWAECDQPAIDGEIDRFDRPNEPAAV